VNICEYCNRDALTGEETVEHAAQLLQDFGLLQALVIVNGPDYGKRRYLELGGLVHLSIEEIPTLR
jgi:hypothetical protein